MILSVVSPADSALVADWLVRTFPGVAPAFVALIAAFLAGRALWALKLVIALGSNTNIPILNTVLEAAKKLWSGDPATGKSGLSWLINPVLMVLAGWLASGSVGFGVILGAAATGLREWVKKSPIPTSTEELMKLKGKLGIVAAGLIGLSFWGGAAHAQRTATPQELAEWRAALAPIGLAVTPAATPASSLKQHLGFTVSGGFAWLRGPGDDHGFPYVTPRATWVLSSRLSAYGEYQWPLDQDEAKEIRAGAVLVLY